MSIRRFNPFSGTNTDRDSARSTRPPTYTSTPAYTSNPTSAHERVSMLSANLPSASSVAFRDSDIMFDQVESSLTDTVSVTGTFAEITNPAGPRYIYYRIYTEDGSIESANPVYTDDSSLGRIAAKLVAPPHTVLTLKHCLLNVENIDNATHVKLFIAASSQAPMDDASSLSILSQPGPGSTPTEPMALVATFSDVARRPLDADAPEGVFILPQEGSTPSERQYLYYRIYRKYGAVRSQLPADSNDPSVGRISVDSVPPPHTAASIMRCIAKAEKLDNSKESQLFTSISSTSPMGEGHVSILTIDRPGSTPEDPMAFVELPAVSPLAKFTKRLRATHTENLSDLDHRWLSTTQGEILLAAQKGPQDEPYTPNGTRLYQVYEAVNTAGRSFKRSMSNPVDHGPL